MKILLLIDSLGSGGAQRQMVTLAEMLKEKQYKVSFLVYHKEDFFKDKLEQLDIPVHYILETRALHRIWKIRKFIRQGGYDAVVSFLETPDFLNNVSTIGGKTWKVITSERSAKESALLSRKGKIYAWFQRYSDALVCNSHNAKAMWEKYYPQYRNKLSVIYNPVLLPEITSEYILKKDGKLHIVVAASYQYLKNPIGLINALVLMNKDERKMIEVNWYGNLSFENDKTNAYQEAVRLVKENKLAEVIKLNEPTKDIANKMKEADVVALFSELEGLPNVICEGMMTGKPIIMTKVSDYATLVDESNGFLCDWSNPESIKEVLIKVIKLPIEELTSLGTASRNKASDLFSADSIIEQWLKILSK